MWEHVWEHEANFSALFFAREENRVLVSCARRAARRAGAGWLSNLNHGQDTRLVHGMDIRTARFVWTCPLALVPRTFRAGLPQQVGAAPAHNRFTQIGQS